MSKGEGWVDYALMLLIGIAAGVLGLTVGGDLALRSAQVTTTPTVVATPQPTATPTASFEVKVIVVDGAPMAQLSPDGTCYLDHAILACETHN